MLRSGDGAPMDAFCYQPTSASPAAGSLISIHGTSHDAWEHLRLWTAAAEETGFQIIAPRFSRRAMKGYQRLRRRHETCSPDTALLYLLHSLRNEGWLSTGPVVMAGYSGGAQFLHRFLMVHPTVAQASILAAPGWWTFPDPTRPFPLGTGPSPQTPTLSLNLEAFLRVPLWVVVGADDVARDSQLRQCASIDGTQGCNRLDRAQRWVTAMESTARAAGIKSGVRLQILPGAGHDFRECMAAGLSKLGLRILRLTARARTLNRQPKMGQEGQIW